ncbi:MAG TPA: adenosylcobinamide-phosphate synthase CbiB [Acidimicrobiales bacterium]|nr:adenosylcobinamide-phosphate synthase CbiB [Acidimicrobiales bacterium]
MVTGAGVLRGLGRRSLAAAGGLVLDRLLGEPPVPDRAHPVALFGSGVAALERRLYADRRAPGAVLAAAAVAGAGAAGAVLRSPVAAAWLAASGRALHDAALRVAAALETGDLDAARAALPWLVGRDPTGLDATAIARAAIESVAENTTDAVVAPALWATAAGATGTFAHRAADTVDSMVGYRDERYRRFGAAAARLDDVLAFVPARVTAALVVLCRPARARAVRRALATDAPAHPSPNAGVAEAAFAAALDVRLGGDANRYGTVVERRPVLHGDGRVPGPADVRAAVALSRAVTRALAALLASAGLAALAAAAVRDRRGGTR